MEIQEPTKTYSKRGRPAQKGRKRHKPNISAQTEAKPNNLTDNPLEPLRVAKQASSTRLETSRVIRLLVAGVPKQKIAKLCNVTLTHCNTLIKEIDNDIETLGWKDYLSVLLSKLRLILDNHTQNSADIQLLLLSADQAITANETALEAIGDSNKKEQQHLQAIAGRLRKERLELMRELNTNNLALTTNLSKMGVTTRPPSQDNKVPTQSSTGVGFTELREVPAGYEKMSKEELVEGLAESNRAVNRYLRAERDKKRALEGGSE